MGRGLVCLLCLPLVMNGCDPIHERMLRPLVAVVD